MFSLDALQRLEEALSGATGAALATVVLYPLEIAKTIMVSRTGKGASKDSTASVLAELVAKSGPLSVYTGMPTKTAQSIVQSFTYYYFYAAIKQLMESPAGGKPGLGMLQNLLAGYLAGVMNMGVSLPLEVRLIIYSNSNLFGAHCSAV